MKQLVALWNREYLEHRGAFLYAPAVLIILFSIGAIAFGKFRLPFETGMLSAQKFYEVAFMGMSQLWWFYLVAALFFYYADAFSADRRNNAMFFWKSMPVTDFKILMSKMTVGMTVFPLINFAFVLLTGVVLYLVTLLAVAMLPRLAMPAVSDIAVSFASIAVFALVHLVLALLWYAPFFAWVGALSTVVKRWSIPLAFLIPIVLSALENAAFFRNGPQGGYIYNWLKQRLSFGLDHTVWQRAFLSDNPVDLQFLLGQLISGIDWVSLVGGLAVAVILVFAASEYRRRVIDT